MESITDRIKSTSSTIHAPRELLSKILFSVTKTPVPRDTCGEIAQPKASQYKKSTYIRATWITSASAVVMSVLFLITTSSPPQNTQTVLDLADEITSEYSTNNTTPTSQASSTLEYIDSLQTIQNLVYAESAMG